MKFKRIASFEVHGEQWEIGYGYAHKVNGVENDGICIYSKKRIVIQSPRRGRTRNLVETVVHELAHARFRDHREDSVEEFGEIVAQVYPAMLEAEKKLTSNPEVAI
jgi:hypothetical protein